MDRSDLEPRILNQASLEISKQYLDCSKAKEHLDWQVSRAFDKSLAETIDG